MTPLATLRVQFNADYTFADATRDVPAFAALGVSHLYASPIWTATAGSTHGYDVVDPGTVSEVLGGEAGLRKLRDRLAAHDIGIVVDIVPNHMGIGAENPWWQGVLRRGSESTYASYFDIEWAGNADVPAGKVLLPVLAEPLSDMLAKRKLSRIRSINGDEDGAFLACDDARWPLASDSCALAESARTVDDWHRVLMAQHFHLAHWPLARDALNWRRFFDITSLAAVCVERAEVFDAVHRLVLRLFADGVIDGVRVDHVDGLSDPGAYCRQLRAALCERGGGREPWIVVEKILMDGEHLDARWQTDGTTGYDFMNDVSALLHDERGTDALNALWRSQTGDDLDFPAHVLKARLHLIGERFGSEMARVTRALTTLIEANADGPARDYGVASLTRCAHALAASFPVYRCYPEASATSVTPDTPNEVLTTAATEARRLLDPLDYAALAQLVTWLTPSGDDTATPTRDLQIRFAQITAPLAAKAVEDTAGYRWGRLLSRNDVGCDAASLSMSVASFHQVNIDRARRWPHAMLTTATHDHKRGEDVRARLAVLSEIPERWGKAVSVWRAENERFGTADQALNEAPDVAHELMLYQTLLGAWPCEWSAVPSEGAKFAEFIERIAQWQRKAIREAGTRTSWLAPDMAYEAACESFLRQILATPSFVASMQDFSDAVGPAGALNGLTQMFLRLTCPGVPDTYQASLGWDQTLVDPDNRRPVRFDAAMSRLEMSGGALGHEAWLTLMDRWRDGDVKSALLRVLLHLRKALSPAFAHGAYVPLTAHGPCEAQVVAFARIPPAGAGAMVVCVATRHAAHHLGAAGSAEPSVERVTPRLRAQDWRNTTLDMAPLSRALQWQNRIDGTTAHTARDAHLPLAALLDALPVAILTPQ